MSARVRKTALSAIVAVIAAGGLVIAGLVIAGRVTADTRTARDSGYRSGHSDGFIKGLVAGEAQGRQEGRVLQEGNTLPPGDRQPVDDAFNAGYAAGANDAFAGYDGGWALSSPYIVTIERASGNIVYRIDTRDPVAANVNYYLCPDGHSLCHEPRR